MTSSGAESSVSVAQSIEVLAIVIVIVTSKFLNCHFNAKRRSPDDSGTLGRVRKVVQSYRIVQLQRIKQSRCKCARENRCINSEHLYLLKADFVRHKAWAVHGVRHAIFDHCDPLLCHTLSHISGPPSLKYVTHLGLLIFSSTCIHSLHNVFSEGLLLVRGGF